jgi:hypothetical protein
MPSPHPQSNAFALCSTLSCLLETISEKGYWTDPQEGWEPILACVAVEVLMDAGLTVDHSWTVPGCHTKMALEAPLRWLNSRIQPDGQFGTDFWETCRLGLLIEKHKLHPYFPNYAELQKYINAVYAANTILSSDSDWIGPGFLAAAADYFDRVAKYAEATALVDRLRSMQQVDGRWYGSVGTTGHPIVSPVWHTAQAVLTLTRKGRTEHREAISKALGWIRTAQDPSGKWPDIQQYVIYSTCYAILALSQAEVVDQPAITRGLDYLKSTMRPDGRFHDFGGTLMAAIALLAAVRQHVGSDLTTIDYVLARNARSQVERAEKEAATAKAEADKHKSRNDELEKRYHNADFGVTKKQLWAAGITVSFIIPTMSAVATRVISTIWPPEKPNAASAQAPPASGASSSVGPPPPSQSQSLPAPSGTTSSAPPPSPSASPPATQPPSTTPAPSSGTAPSGTQHP